MKKTIFTFLLFGFVASALSAQTTNCTADEQVIFSCTAGKKTISVCSAPKNSTVNYIEYRFTSGDKPKFSYRSDKANGSRKFNRATPAGASSASTVLWFENQGYFYVVSDPVKGIPSLVVQKEKKEISTTECKADMTIDLNITNTLIKDVSSDDYFEIFN